MCLSESKSPEVILSLSAIFSSISPHVSHGFDGVESRTISSTSITSLPAGSPLIETFGVRASKASLSSLYLLDRL